MSTYENFKDKKASFEEMFVSEDKALHNSNMLNLVSAVRSIDDELTQLEARIVEMKALREEITDFAKGDVSNTTKVSELYDKATGHWKSKRKVW